MLKFGMNTLLWSIDFNDKILPVCEKLKEFGFDGIEAPIFDHDVKKYERLGKRLDDLGLGRTAVTCRYPDDNPISTDPKVRALGVTNTCKIIDCCQALGVEVLAGPYHSCMGLFTNKAPTADEWKWSIEGMRKVAEHAQQAKVMLGIEYLNRFEIYLLNTAADTARYVREVEHPNCRMMYDTFHANIEEKNIGDSIRVCKNETVHIHISENDRGVPRHRPRRLERHVQRAQRDRLQGLADDRGLRLGISRNRGRHEDLAGAVPRRVGPGPRRPGVHEEALSPARHEISGCFKTGRGLSPSPRRF